MQSANPRPKRGRQSITLHSVAEAATKILGCSEMHVYRLIAAGELPAVDIAMPGAGRPKTRIRSDDLADYIERRTRARSGAAR
jgi:excisionase family DNA binding protein